MGYKIVKTLNLKKKFLNIDYLVKLHYVIYDNGNRGTIEIWDDKQINETVQEKELILFS